VLGGVGVAGADVARLELLELLLGAEFVGLWGGGVVLRRERDGVEMRLRKGWKGPPATYHCLGCGGGERRRFERME